jgi:DNA polymerase I-like protein with 3'-5' exonuclease and polymerase domains
MPLLDLPKRDSKESIIKKAKTKPKSVQSVVNGIDQVRQRVNANLGKYADKYKVITDVDAFNKYIDKCIEEGVVAIDTETTGLNPILDKIVGLSLKSPTQVGVYIPINHTSVFTKTRIETQLTEQQVKESLQRLVDNVGTIWHNGKFDIRVLKWQVGIEVKDENIIWDTLIGSHLLNENEPHGLKYLYNNYIIKQGKEEEEIFKYSDLFEGTNFAEVPIDTAYIYAAHDAEMTYELFNFQWPYLNYENITKDSPYSGISYVFNYVELPAIKVVSEMENQGVSLDIDYAKGLEVKYRKELEQAKQDFYKELDKHQQQITSYNIKNPGKLTNPINYSSPKQLAILLYDILKLEAVSKDNPRGTGEDILIKLDTPLGDAVLKCRALEKLLGTYIEKLPKDINQKTNKVHTNFNLTGTVTGRFSSSDPNLQNIPSQNKDIRKMFVADKGYVFIGSDYSQQEPRILAHMSGDEELKKAYKEGKDIYAWVSSLVYKLPYEQCLETRPDGTKNPEAKQRRNIIKAIVLGVMYSKGPASIAETLNISKKEAEEVMKTFFTTFPRIKTFISESQLAASKKGFVETAWGRKRRLPDMLLPEYEFSVVEGAVENFDPLDFGVQKKLEITPDVIEKYTSLLSRAFGYKKVTEIIDNAKQDGIIIKANTMRIEDAKRQCVNSRIQGSAADMIKSALIRLGRNQELKDLGFRLLMTVHDEIIGQAPYENRKRAGELLSKIMIEAALEKISVPMKCDVEITTSWTGKEVE